MTKRRNRRACVVIYCTAADGEQYGVFGISSGGFTRDELVWMHLKSIEDTDGDTVKSIYMIPGDHTADQLHRMAETMPPANARLIYSQNPSHNDRGHPPAKSKCLTVDALLNGGGEPIS